MTTLDFVRLTRHNLRQIVGLILLGLLLAAGWTALQRPVYEASSTGIVLAGSSGSIDLATSGQSLATSRAPTYLPLISSQAVAKRVATIMGGTPAGGVAGRLRAEVVKGTAMIRVSATAYNAKEAQALSDAGLQALADEIQRLETINDPTPTPTPSATRTTSDSESPSPTTPVVVSRTRVPTAGTVIQLVAYESAQAPSAPISPNLPMNLLAGALVGLLLGFSVAFIRKGLDQRIRSVDEIEELTSAGVLGVIPDSPELAEQRQGGDLRKLGAASEAMRQLRTNLRFVAVDAKPRAFVVTSANPSEGKSTVSANLARVFAESGVKTVLIDADLRRPMQSRTFDVDSTIGLTQVLAGDISFEDAVQGTDHPNLLILPAGRIPPNPSELVGSQRMADLTKGLKSTYVVVIDAPPLLPVTDAGLLAAEADGAILVLRVNKTYKEQVRMCARILSQVNATLFGCVMNRAPRRGMGAVMYGYGYGYGGYEQTDYYESADGTRKPDKRGRRRQKRSWVGGSGGGSDYRRPSNTEPARGARRADPASVASASRLDSPSRLFSPARRD